MGDKVVASKEKYRDFLANFSQIIFLDLINSRKKVKINNFADDLNT